MAATIVERTFAGHRYRIEVNDEKYVRVQLLDADGNVVTDNGHDDICFERMLPEPMRAARFTLRMMRGIVDGKAMPEAAKRALHHFIDVTEIGVEAELANWGIRGANDRPNLLAERR